MDYWTTNIPLISNIIIVTRLREVLLFVTCWCVKCVENLGEKSVTINVMNALIEDIRYAGENVLQIFIADVKQDINERLNFITKILSHAIIQKQLKNMNSLFSWTKKLEFINLYGKSVMTKDIIQQIFLTYNQYYTKQPHTVRVDII